MTAAAASDGWEATPVLLIDRVLDAVWVLGESATIDEIAGRIDAKPNSVDVTIRRHRYLFTVRPDRWSFDGTAARSVLVVGLSAAGHRRLNGEEEVGS